MPSLKFMLPVAVGAIGLLAAAFIALESRTSTNAADTVTVYESYDDRTGRVFQSLGEAHDFAVNAADFGPLVPSDVPDGYHVTYIGVGNASPPDAGPKFRRVQVRLEGPEGDITIIVANQPFGFAGDEDENVIERPQSGARLYRQDNDDGSALLTLITESSGVVLSTGAERPDDDQLRRIILSYLSKEPTG